MASPFQTAHRPFCCGRHEFAVSLLLVEFLEDVLPSTIRGEGARRCKHVGKEGSHEGSCLSRANQSSGSNSKPRGPYSTRGNSPGEEFIRILVIFTPVRINRSFQAHCNKIQTLYQGLRSCAVQLLLTQLPSDSADTFRLMSERKDMTRWYQ